MTDCRYSFVAANSCSSFAVRFTLILSHRWPAAASASRAGSGALLEHNHEVLLFCSQADRYHIEID